MHFKEESQRHHTNYPYLRTKFKVVRFLDVSLRTGEPHS